jgi:hypothetical protein
MFNLIYFTLKRALILAHPILFTLLKSLCPFSSLIKVRWPFLFLIYSIRYLYLIRLKMSVIKLIVMVIIIIIIIIKILSLMVYFGHLVISIIIAVAIIYYPIKHSK